MNIWVICPSPIIIYPIIPIEFNNSYILKLSIPIFFANLAIPMVGIIDTTLMGNLGNLSYLSATSVAANLFSMLFWSFGFLRMGTVGMVSQAHGKNDYNI